MGTAMWICVCSTYVKTHVRYPHMNLLATRDYVGSISA